MDPVAISVLEKVAEQGVVAAMLFVCVYFLSRTLKSQYDDRIKSVETRSSECEKDRIEMRREIRQIQSERISSQESRIAILEDLLAKEEG